MEEQRIENSGAEPAEVQQEKPAYVPRPAWQVWAARIGLVVFIGIVIVQILQLAGIGL